MANAAIAAGDYEGFLSFCTDSSEWIFVGEQTINGKEGVRQYLKDAYAEPPKIVVENLISENDYLTAVGNITIKNKNNQEKSFQYCDVWRLENGKLAQLRAFVIQEQ